MRIITIFVMLSFFTLTKAQVRLDKPEVYFGASAGVTESMVIFKPAVSQGYLLGYNGGIVFRYIAEKNVGMQAELNFSQRGWTEATGLYTRHLNYIELPFMTHIYMGKKNRVFLNFGPKISYLISENVVRNETSNIELQHITKTENPFDYGLCAGLGFLINIKGSIYQLDTRANYGLSDVFSNTKSDYFETSNNLNVSVNLAWLFQTE